MMTRDGEPLTCPPMAIMPIGSEHDDCIEWALVVPVDVEMFGFRTVAAVAPVWTATMSAN